MKTISVPYFANAEVNVCETSDLSDPTAQAALDNFLKLTNADRLSHARHIHANYRGMHDAVGGEDWMDQQFGVPTLENIWDLVIVRWLHITHGSDSNCYVDITADCPWEIEHGLSMVWLNGETLIKVGAIDGHSTNSPDAPVHPELGATIHYWYDRRFHTFERSE